MTTNQILNIIFNSIGFIILIWTIVTICKTDGLLRYRHNEVTDETEEIELPCDKF